MFDDLIEVRDQEYWLDGQNVRVGNQCGNYDTCHARLGRKAGRDTLAPQSRRAARLDRRSRARPRADEWSRRSAEPIGAITGHDE
jgi:hypothetical protein